MAKIKRFPRLKSIVLNIRGSNGSGKSTVVRRFLGLGFKPLYNGIPDKPEKIWGYQIVQPRMVDGDVKFLSPPLFIIGPYENPSGGCDCLPNFDLICKQIAIMAKYGNVIFEGAVVSTVAKRWAELQEEMKKYAHFIFGTLDTPQSRCVKRVNKRRAKKGKGPIDPTKSMDGKYKAVRGSAIGLEKLGMDVRVLPHKKAFKTIRKWLREEYGANDD